MIAPVYRDDPRLAPLIGPGGPFEVEEIVLDGVPLRVFVRAPRTIIDTFDMGMQHADLDHLVHEDERLTFADVRARALSLAEQLRTTFGVRAGDRVAIAMRNLPEFVIGFWGAALVGAIVVPLNSWWTGAELGYALDDAGAKVAFVDDDRLERVLDHGRPAGVQLVSVRTDRTGADAPFDDLVHGTPLADDAIARLDVDDPVTILYTSGTTGRPKGALGTNRNHLHNIWNMAFGGAREAILSSREPAPARQPATLAAQPMFHIGGIAAIIGSPMGGSKILIMRKWNLDEAMQLAVQEGLTGFGGVPAIARQIIEYPGLEDLDLDVRCVPDGRCRGAARPPAARRASGSATRSSSSTGTASPRRRRRWSPTWASSSSSAPTAWAAPTSPPTLRSSTPRARVLGVGEVGELCFRSPQVVKGYWNDEAATEGVVRRRMVPLRRRRLRRATRASCTWSTGSRTS